MGIGQDVMVGMLLGERSMLLGYINAILRDPMLSEDVLQEVAIVALRKYEALIDVKGFGPWIRTIARLQALNALRKRDHAPMLLGDALVDLIDDTWKSNDSISERERLEALRRCLDKLTKRAQELVHLRYHHGQSGVEIASSLKQPLNTVYVALTRIHRTLGDCMRRSKVVETADG